MIVQLILNFLNQNASTPKGMLPELDFHHKCLGGWNDCTMIFQKIILDTLWANLIGRVKLHGKYVYTFTNYGEVVHGL